MDNSSILSGAAPDTSRDSSGSAPGNRSLRVAENEKRRSERDPVRSALSFLSQVQDGTIVKGNDQLEKSLVVVETVALGRGLPPEAVSLLLDLALSLRAGSVNCGRILKFLIPASVVPQEAVVRGVSWLCVGRLPINSQVLFLRWVLTVFDLIDFKDHLRAIYGFIFSFVTEENLVCTVLCHLSCTITHITTLHVRQFLYFNLYHISVNSKMFFDIMVQWVSNCGTCAGFKNYNSTWKATLTAVQRKNRGDVTADLSLTTELKEKPASRKRKLHHLEVPALSSAFDTSAERKVFRLQEMRTFEELLQNIHNIELPAQMGSLLGSSLALHFLDCVQDESAFLRLNFWLGHSLQEEFLLCSADGGSDSPDEAARFLNTVLSSQQFLQEGFFSTESFLYKFLSVWDGSLLRTHILDLLSHIPLMPSHYIKILVFEPLMQLYFTSTVFFKCSVIECLNNMLVKWLTWHSVNALEEGLDISLNSNGTVTMTLSGFMDTVIELVRFVGRLASEGLRLENCHVLLLSQTLAFYETVCDMFVRYGLPLVIMPPAGVFYPALLATDSLSVDRLGYIMYRYRKNLTLAKKQEQQSEQTFHISRNTYQEFNQHLVAMVSCLWNSKSFLPGTGIEIDKQMLLQSKVPEHWSHFDLVHHPAFFKYAFEFHQKCWPARSSVDLASIKVGKYWNWYVEFLFSQGFDGLSDFIQVNTGHSSSSGSSSQGDGHQTNQER
uniref:Centromere protein I n=1 Tax=Astyanax mexicanus TaxID=7994 RepID=A0A8B9J686_ASTMX